MMNHEKALWAFVGIVAATAGLALGVPRTFSAGNVVSAAEMNENFAALQMEVDSLRAQVVANDRFRGARVYLSPGYTSVPDQRLIEFQTEMFDTDGFHESVSPTRFRIPAGLGGTYWVACHTSWGNTTAGQNVGTVLHKNSVVDVAVTRVIAGQNNRTTEVQASTLVQLVAGDYVECKTYAAPAGGDIIGDNERNTWFELVRLGG